MKHVYCRIMDCDFNEHMKVFPSMISEQLIGPRDGIFCYASCPSVNLQLYFAQLSSPSSRY